MRATDFMIGDWVYKKFGVLEENKPFKIDEIIHEDLCGYEVLDHYGLSRAVEDIYPIPLTEEILRANGFEYNDRGVLFNTSLKMHIIVDSHHVDIIRRYDVDEEFDHNESLWMNNRTIQYVHELQHALRLFGMNNLADNFKIAMEE